MSHTHFIASFRSALTAALLVTSLMLVSFFAFEPSVGRAVTDNFTVTQEITGEISFLVAADNVTMNGSISGITGGYATGTTRAVVRSNNPAGYSMTLHFATTTSGHSMQASSTAYINDYSPASNGVPDYNWIDNTTGQAAEFGYSVLASTTAEVAQAFRASGSACNQGGGTPEADRCWLNPTTSPQMIITTGSPTAVSGSTSTLKFKVAVPSGPSPALPTGFYVATGTLTATNN